MNFSAPEWLFLIPALLVAGWRWRRTLRLHEPLRALALLALVLALAGLRLRLASGGLDLWVLVDRSDSAAAAIAHESNEIASILQESKGSDDRVIFVDYATSAVQRDRGDPEYEDDTRQTRTGAALEFTLAQLEPGRAARILALTDGYATEPLGDAAEKLLRSGVALDYRLLGDAAAADWRVAGFDVPPRVLPGEAFIVDFVIAGTGDADVPWEVWRDGHVAASGVARVWSGAGHVRLSDRLMGSGAARYEVRLKPANDAHPENNTAGAWVEVTGGPRVLLVTNYPDDPLAALLAGQGLAIERVTDPATLDAARLSGVRLVILNNVPVNRLPAGFIDALDFYVREQGGGLLMAGGANSFGSGGYFASAIDDLLPVSMELKKEQHKVAVAMAIVMDRSGSMSMSAGNGLMKIDLANSGAARAVELLGDYDAVSVHAVDTEAHLIVELAQIKGNRNQISENIRHISSGGGGIYIYEGLKAGWGQLKRAETGTRHLVLFADANDSPHSDGWQSLVDEMRAGGATVSVIGLGTENDHYATLLRDIAERGGGRIFFNADANELPAIFAEETVAIARATFVTDPTPVQAASGWAEIGAHAPKWPAQVDSYNLSYLRPGAAAPLLTADEYKAPLVAAWARGAGHVAAVSFPLGGPHSEMVRAWPGLGDFVQTLARWLAGEDAPPGLAIRPTVAGDRLALDLLYDENWTGRVAQTPPVALVAGIGRSGNANTHPLVWEKIEPGHFRTTAPLPAGGMLRGSVRIGATALPFGPVSAFGSAEWEFDHARRLELQQLATRSGGRERLDLATVWSAPRTATWRPLTLSLLVLWALCFVADAALSRLEISLLPARGRS